MDRQIDTRKEERERVREKETERGESLVNVKSILMSVLQFYCIMEK